MGVPPLPFALGPVKSPKQARPGAGDRVDDGNGRTRFGWRGGISFGGVVSFIFADLIILPILDIYRKYYGWKVMGYILVTFYVTMAAAGYVVELLFGALGIIPTNRQVVAISEGVQWNYTSVLNILFLLLAAILVVRFLHTGGLPMLRMMNTPAHDMSQHDM